MKLTVLGCNGPFPAAGGACSGYLLEAEDTRVLLDCGAGVLAALTERISPETLDAVVLSHLHYDPMSDMLPLIYRMQGKGRLPVYAPQAPAQVRALLEGAFDVRDLEHAEHIGALSLDVLPVRHPVPCFAVRYTAGGTSVCYTGDTNTCDGLTAWARDSDLLLADACFTDALWAENKPHLSARLAAEVARNAGAKRLVLTHFTPGTDQAVLLSEAREVCPVAVLAHPGLQVEF